MARFSGGSVKFSGVGRTMAGKMEKVASESERLAAHEKAHRKKVFSVVISILIIVVAIFGVCMGAKLMMKKVVGEDDEDEKYEPTITIVDEGSRGVTEKMKDYVGMLEADLKDLGLTAVKAVVPENKLREVDVYISGFKGYFKCSLDRGTAVTAEDILSMVKYLKGKKVKKVGYVDVRIAGRAYYK